VLFLISAACAAPGYLYQPLGYSGYGGYRGVPRYQRHNTYGHALGPQAPVYRSQIRYRTSPRVSTFTAKPAVPAFSSRNIVNKVVNVPTSVSPSLEEKYNFEVSFNNDNRQVNVGAEVNEALRVPVVKDSRIAASIDFSSPSAAAALAFMKEITSKDGLCGIPTEIFLENILKGRSREEANAEATQSYLRAYNRGERLVPGSPCAKADLAWREAVVAGTDPVLESALAFMNAWPGVQEGNPCAVSGAEYVKAILAGSSHLEANRKSVASFARSLKDLATSGRSIKDKACLNSAKAFWAAVPASEKPDPAIAKAFLAFADKIFNDNAPGYDPVCLAGLEGFFDSYAAGDDLLTANLKAARSFFSEFQRGRSSIPADSACAAATLAYAQNIPNKPSGPSASGMMAYIAESIKSGQRSVDPVCAAAAESYFDAYIAQRSEAAASEAAAVAYLEAIDANPDFDQTSACARSAEAYIAEFDI